MSARTAGSCITCGMRLSGRQRRFCSRVCRNRDTNRRLEDDRPRRSRGAERKRTLLDRFGGRCGRCGDDRNPAALAFHHVDPTKKTFQLDLRRLSNRSWTAFEAEANPCVAVCADCHAELHHPLETTLKENRIPEHPQPANPPDEADLDAR